MIFFEASGVTTLLAAFLSLPSRNRFGEAGPPGHTRPSNGDGTSRKEVGLHAEPTEIHFKKLVSYATNSKSKII